MKVSLVSPSALSVSACLVLAGCSILSGAKERVSGSKGRRDPGAKGSVPAVSSDDSDPPHVVSAIGDLDTLEKAIEERNWGEVGRRDRHFQGAFLVRDAYKDDAKGPALKKRFMALDALAFKTFGGRLPEMIGDTARVQSGVDPDAIEMVEEAISACQQAAKTTTTGRGDAKNKLREAVLKYEAAAKRARKMDPQVMRYFGEGKSGTIDVPTNLLECEAEIASAMVQFEDEYEPEVAKESKTERGCGTIEWLADGIQVGSGRFAEYSRSEGGASFPERVPCRKLAKRNKFPKPLRAAVEQFKEYVGVRDMVVVAVGKPFIRANDDDLRLHRYQQLIAYSPKFEFASNPCGEGKTFCEAGGSRGARAYNELEHHLDRAQVHAGKDSDRCKAHLKAAKKNWSDFEELRAELQKSGQWVKGAVYRTKKGTKLPEAAFVASFEEKSRLAEERLTEKYCSKPRKPDGAAPSPAKTKRRGDADEDERGSGEEQDEEEE